MSEIENLKTIKKKGIKYFLAQEEKKWIDSASIYCVHDKKRYSTSINKKSE